MDNAKGIIYNSRLTFVPYYAKDGERYLHFGGHYLYRDNHTDGNLAAGAARIGGFGRAAAWFTPTANTLHYNQGGLEMAWANGPLTIASEWYAGSFGKGHEMYGGYVEARYFLTGDSRPYNKRTGTVGGVRTKQNVFCAEGFIQTCHGKEKGFGIQSLGAWEVFAQWGFTDSDRVYFADTANNAGGRTVDTVLGVNWYWNPNTRMMFEYVHSDGTQQGGYRATEDIFAASFRFHF